jgi:hypothetical protein
VLLHISKKVRRGEKRWNPQAERGRLSFGVSLCRRGEQGKKRNAENDFNSFLACESAPLLSLWSILIDFLALV